MKSQLIAQYTQPHQFEPLLPEAARNGPLRELAGALIVEATQLSARANALAQQELRALLRSMNSYYTNRIEGEHTRPSEIEQALQQDFSASAEVARKQRLALAHIRAEQACEAALQAQPADRALAWLYEPPQLLHIHATLFASLPEPDLRLSDGSLLQPGALRERGVAVGRHEAPPASALPAFLARWQQVYAGEPRGEAAVVAAAASHHRLAWIHPFLDGNGRAARLHTHLLFSAMGLCQGLWSPLRGFARRESDYKALLQAADEHRRGDLDGRGNLSHAALLEWIRFVLESSLDQVRFMGELLNLARMRERMVAALSFEASQRGSGVRLEALRPLHYLFATAEELPRAEFKAMTGLGERVATGLVSVLLREGYLASDSPYGTLRFAIPRHALRFYFPALWPEAEAENLP